MLQRFLLVIFLFCQFAFTSAQDSKSIYIKGNALTLPVLFLNGGFEFQLSDQYTLQTDAFVSPWKSYNGQHAQVYMGHIEGRYYFKQAFDKWYIGGNLGTGVFDLTKWGHVHLGQYQKGYLFMFGAVVGYQWKWKEKWNIDFFLRGGSTQSYYRGYNPDGSRYEETPSNWNKSAEFLPFGGGIMISYKLR